MRAKNLELITDDGVSAFYKQLGAKGSSRKKEPMDDQFPVEPIELFSEAVEILSKHSVNLRRIIDETLLLYSDFHTITDIEPIANKEKILRFKKGL